MNYNKQRDDLNQTLGNQAELHRAKRLKKSIDYMQPDARQKYQHIYNKEHSWLSRVKLSHIWCYGGIAIVIVLLLCWGIASFEEKPRVSSKPKTAHINKSKSKQASLPTINQIHTPDPNHYYMAVKLTPAQVEFFNQFYYTDRSRRDYTKLKDVYNARVAKINKLIKHYSNLETSYQHKSSHHAKYMVVKCRAEIRFLKRYKHVITVQMYHRYPHFKAIMKDHNTGSIHSHTTHVRHLVNDTSTHRNDSVKPVYRRLVQPNVTNRQPSQSVSKPASTVQSVQPAQSVNNGNGQ